MLPIHPINVFWSAKDDAWVTDVPDVTYCSALGDSPHDAVADVEGAIAAWLEAARSSGRSIPPPTARMVRA